MYSLLESPGLGDRRPSQLLQDMRALLPEKEPEGAIFTGLFLKRLPTTMADAILAAGLDTVAEMATMADRLYDRPAVADTRISAVADTRISAVSARPPCCHSDIAAVSAPRRRNDRRRADKSPDRRAARSPDRRAATPGRRMDWDEFKSQNFPRSGWTKGATKDWCKFHQYWGAAAVTCNPGCTYQGN